MERKYFDLAKQAYNRKNSIVDGVTYSTEEKNKALREAFEELVPSGKNRYKSYRRNRLEIFEIIEETIDEVAPLKVDEAFGRFAQIKGFAQGEKPRFKLKKGKRGLLNFITKVGLGGVLERGRMDVGYVDVKPEAFGGAVYVEFERFLDGAVDFTELIDVILDGIVEKINNQIQSTLIATFDGLATSMKATNNSFVAADMGKLIQNVSSYGRSACIFCTPAFAGTIEETSGFVSDTDKSERREYGYIGKFRSANVIVLPNAFTDETNTAKVLKDEFAFVIPTNEEKIVKVGFEGETRMKDEENADDSLEFQAYKKFGIAIVSSNYFAMYRNTSLA